MMRSIQPSGPYHVAGYSYGASVVVAMTLVADDIAAAVLLDGSPDHYKASYKAYMTSENSPEALQQTKVLCTLANYLLLDQLSSPVEVSKTIFICFCIKVCKIQYLRF